MIFTGYKFEDGMVRVLTLDGEFVYPSDKFKDLVSLEKEINKKLLFMEKTELKKAVCSLEADLLAAKVPLIKDKVVIPDLVVPDPVEVVKDA